MNPVLATLGRRLRLGVIGGGPGSFIGPVHRTAARLDDRFEITAAALSSDAERSRAAALELGIAADRAYADWHALLDGERARTDGVDAVAVMTPNDSHHAICAAALERGYDVICDKPLTTNLADALDLVRRVRASGRVFCVTHNYTAYPDGPARARPGPGRCDRRRAPDPARLCPGPQRDPGRGREQQAQLALRSQDRRPVPGPGRHRHPRPPSGRLRLRPGADRGDGRGLGHGARPHRRRHRERADALVRRRARHDVGDQRRGRRGARPVAAASSAPPAASNGSRSSPTSCGTGSWTAPR